MTTCLRRHPLAVLQVLVVLSCSSTPVFAQAARAYHVEDLGSFDDAGGDLVGLAINSDGDIAGYGYRRDGSIRAFRWTAAAGLEDLGANGGRMSQAFDINDRGDVVGVYVDLSGNAHGFVAPRHGALQDVWTPDRQIVRVNSITNDGRLTGVLNTFQVHAFRTLADGTVQDLGDSMYASVGWAINDGGEVSGYEARSLDGNTQSAFRFADGMTKADLGTLGGARSSGLSINREGVVVGWSEGVMPTEWSRAFRARPGFPIEDLGTLGGSVAGAEHVNDAGTIVGWSSGPFWMTAFVYTDADGMIDLNSRVVAPGILYDAYAINAAGQIVVGYQLAGRTGTYRLTPIVDQEPPVITSATVYPEVLAPPDGRMVPVTVHAGVSDNLDAAPTCQIAGVTNSEALGADGDPDVQITGPFTVALRALRLGSGTGRTYTIALRCSDMSGNVATTELVVRVPHDSR